MSSQAISPRYEILETAPSADTPPFLVSKARDLEEGRVVCLLVLPAEILGAAQADFQSAVRQAQEVEDSGILRVYDQGISEETGELFVAREYMRGIALQERIRRIAPFSLTVAADIAASVAESLTAAHRVGVTHGDLRPLRILLSPEGQIKVADFAYGAIASSRTEDVTRLPYLAPELGPEDSSFAGDIYALGAILYEMLTGASPLVGGTRVTSPRAINPSVPPALDGIVQKALHTDLSIRYRSASGLLADLQAVREALRSGKSVAWSPLMQKSGEKRVPRPAAAEPVLASPLIIASPGSITAAALELDEERARVPEFEKQEMENRADMREDKRREREPISVLGIATSIMFVIAILGVIGLTWYLTKFMQPPNDVQVPNLIGKTFDDAKRIAEQQHFTLVENPGSTYSDTMPENQIYEQSPLSGHTIKAEKEVTVFRSLGPRLLVVPDLVGTTQDHATQALESAKFPSPGTVAQEFSETVPSGIIIRQSPDRQSRVARNTAVNFVVSKGRQPPESPTQVQSIASGPDKVDLNWEAATRAQSYTILRSLDGEVVTVARALAATHFTDTGLKPDTTYSYTINAVNSAGESGPSESSLVTTSPKVEVPVVLPPNTVVTPPVDPSTSAPDLTPPPDQPQTASLRQFTIEFRVPRRPRRTRHVQIEIQDTTGTNLVYDENHDAGETVSAPVQGIGHKVTFRIFLDNKLVKQQTF